jgi:ubiquinone/menaquinone biosynthesis C-methylase UbiE
MEKSTCVCPPILSLPLDNFIRKRFHNPIKIFGKYIREGMTVMDLGCGPGYFIEAFAHMTGNNGIVIAADLQEKMLEKARKKIKGRNFESRVKFHKCGKDSIGFDSKADFINAFFMVHEVPSSENLIKEIYTILNKGGIFFLCEPKVHVSKKEFNNTIKLAENIGFKILDMPNISISRTAVFIKN